MVEATSRGGSARLPPLLRWAGSKRQILETLAQAWPGDDHRYVEPFAGSACLFFHLRPVSALLADINAELVTTYCVLADDPDGVYVKLAKFGPASKEVYYSLRAQEPHLLEPTDRAASNAGGRLPSRCWDGSDNMLARTAAKANVSEEACRRRS